MNLSDYIGAIENTAIYPGANTGRGEALVYLALGLAGEGGEVAEAASIFLGPEIVPPTDLEAELGDLLWYLARLQVELGELPLEPSGEGEMAILPVPALLRVMTGTGRIADHAKKYLRGDYDLESLRDRLRSSLFDLKQGVEEFVDVLRFNIDELRLKNVKKLQRRLAAGTLLGSGDNR